MPEPVESTGASCFAFTPDGTKLVMACAMTGYILVIDLSGDKPQVLRRFEQHRARDVVLGQRIIRGRSKSVLTEDVDMDGAEKEVGEGMNVDASRSADEDEDEVVQPLPQKPVTPIITRLAISPDGQYLASTSSTTRTHIFNLDSITYTCTLPSFPAPIHALAFTALSR